MAGEKKKKDFGSKKGPSGRASTETSRVQKWRAEPVGQGVG